MAQRTPQLSQGTVHSAGYQEHTARDVITEGGDAGGRRGPSIIAPVRPGALCDFWVQTPGNH